MRKRWPFILTLLLFISSSITVVACDTTKVSQPPKKPTLTEVTLLSTSTPITLPKLEDDADPGSHIVYNHTGTEASRVIQSFTSENSLVILGSCLGKGSIAVHVDPATVATIPCSQTGQPVTEDRSPSIPGQTCTVQLTMQGSNIQWAVLVETSKSKTTGS